MLCKFQILASNFNLLRVAVLLWIRISYRRIERLSESSHFRAPPLAASCGLRQDKHLWWTSVADWVATKICPVRQAKEGNGERSEKKRKLWSYKYLSWKKHVLIVHHFVVNGGIHVPFFIQINVHFGRIKVSWFFVLEYKNIFYYNGMFFLNGNFLFFWFSGILSKVSILIFICVCF